MQYVADTGSSAISLSASTAKTCLMIQAPSTASGMLVEWGVFFNGTNSANEPVLVEMVKSSEATNSTPGTNNTSVTPVQVRGASNTSGSGLAALFTAFANSTSEPTVLTVLKRFWVPPTSGQLVQLPLGREAEVIPSTGLGLRLTAPNAVSARAYMEFIQGPS